jgi:nucleoid-associated protein YgaU
VDSFDEEVYRCKPGDTFDKISTNHYHTERYALALLLFNRDHPLASDAVRRDPPQLEPGLPVYLPPTRILEARYRSVITGLPSPTETAPSSRADVPRVDRSANSSPQPGAAPAGVWTAPLGYQQYRVQPQGETMREIARATLGTGERWAEIYKLNPTFRPEYRVPGGTMLRLPPDARPDQGSAPQ